MARYTGPSCRICRRYGEKLLLKGDRCLSPKCAVERRPTPPGAHAAVRRRKVSERGMQLREKQKARYIYGVLEKQFRHHIAEAEQRAKSPGGARLLSLLELRLDNVVYRLGFAESRPMARQLVNHGHILVNGRKASIPSFLVKPGDAIAWKQSSLKKQPYKEAAKAIQGRTIPGWLSLDLQTLTGKVLGAPERGDIDAHADEQQIKAFYSR